MLKHGECRTVLNKVWRNMKDRCYNPHNKRYLHYGGRGIVVCDEWKGDYWAFRQWSHKNGYAENLSIDRIDNDGNYEPSNCRWSTPEEQNNNFSRNVVIAYRGKTMSISQWSRATGIPRNTLDYRIKKGWDMGKALNYPDIIQHGDAFAVREEGWQV